MTTAIATNPLHDPYELTPEHIRFFRQQGYIKLKDVLSADTLAHYHREISRKVKELNTLDKPMEQRTTYEKAFLQIMNIWTKSKVVEEFVRSKRLAKLATDLMGCRGVRMYHDQALYKEPGGGITPWHADQYYWPVDTDNTCTVWIPLQKTPLELGALTFSAKSHRFHKGRDIEISDTSEETLRDALREESLHYVEEPFDLGEVSYHLGWTFHRAGANTTDRPREVMTIIYVDKDARVVPCKNKNQENDWKTWLSNTPVGQIPETPLTPILFSYDQ